jgi:hypothetical protein
MPKALLARQPDFACTDLQAVLTMQATMSKILDTLKKNKWGPTRIARALEIKPQAVSQWGDEVPVRRAQEVADLTGIPVHRLCPSYFKAPKKQREAA